MLLTINALGISESVKCVQTPNAFVMDPQPYYGEGMTGKQIRERDHLVVHASATPGSSTLHMKSRNGKRFSYDWDTCPHRTRLSWRLNECKIIGDQLLDGLEISDWSYFTKQRRAIYAAVLRKLKAVGHTHEVALRHAQQASREYAQIIKRTRGVDLSAPIPEDMRRSDIEYETRHRQRMMNA